MKQESREQSWFRKPRKSAWSGPHSYLSISLGEGHVHICAFIPVSLK